MNHFGTEPVEKQCHIATTVLIMNTGRLAVDIPDICLSYDLTRFNKI